MGVTDREGERRPKMQDKQEELGTEENGGVAVLFKGLTEITKEFANLTDSANDK